MTNVLMQVVRNLETILEKIPEIRYAGDPILRQVAGPVTLEEGLSIGERLAKVLVKYREITGTGRGLAAPQIGESKSVFVTYLDDKIETFINPEITERSRETNFYRESCMSAGIVAADVERAERIVLTWIDKDGVRQTGNFDGFVARLYQHEEAHLRGRLNLDDAAPGGILLVTFDPFQEKLRSVR